MKTRDLGAAVQVGAVCFPTGGPALSLSLRGVLGTCRLSNRRSRRDSKDGFSLFQQKQNSQEVITEFKALPLLLSS